MAGLALGLPFYGAFRLLAAAWYALDDSRTPAIAALAFVAACSSPEKTAETETAAPPAEATSDAPSIVLFIQAAGGNMAAAGKTP